MFKDPLFLLLGAVMIGVVVILGMGIAQMGRGTPEAAKRSNKFMQMRLAAQALAVVLLMVFLWARSKG